jgi:hypothetical protein
LWSMWKGCDENMNTRIEKCMCLDMDCLPNWAFCTNENNESVEFLVCSVCGRQIETQEE